MLPCHLVSLYFFERCLEIVEDEVNFGVVYTHADVDNLTALLKPVNRLIPDARTIYQFWSYQLWSTIPNFEVILKRACWLAHRREFFPRITPHIDNNLFWLINASPGSWIKSSSIKMDREHKNVLVFSLVLLGEILTEFSNACVYAIHSRPSFVIVQL